MTKKLLALSFAKYAGAMTVHATSMTRKEYNDFRDWTLPADENGDDEGYLIEDREGKKNTEWLDGFVQWLPVDEFTRKFSNLSNLNTGEIIACNDFSTLCEFDKVKLLIDVIRDANQSSANHVVDEAQQKLLKIISKF